MNDDQVINQNFCEHCNRKFIREASFFKHICEPKRRWLDREKPNNRIGFNSWRFYYQKHHPNKKNIEYKDYINSNYYNAFLKFGTYCIDVEVVDPFNYFNYLINNRISIDSWTSDSIYTKYLIEYLVLEDPLDSVKRTVNYLMDITAEENIILSDVFRYINNNKLCYSIIKGKITPWVLYHSTTGQEFLSKLDKNQMLLIFEYINPEKWNIKFKRNQETVNEVKNILSKIPL